MSSAPQSDDRRAALAVSLVAGLIGGLCCVAPIVLVLLGLATVSVANDWGNVLYGDYKWHFRAAAIVFLAAAVVIYFRRRGVCTLDQAKRERNRILNMVLLAALGFLAVYMTWTYLVLHYWGIAAGLPWAQWDETWAIPWAAGLCAAVVLMWRLGARLTRTRR